MFTKTTRESSSSSARAHTRAVFTSTPITPETTTSAPSTTRRLAIVSAWKPESPGVSIRLILRPCHSRCASDDGERHLPPLLVLVPVGDGRARLDGAEAVDRARLEEHRLDERGLARPAVADDGDVADLPGLLGHSSLLSDAWSRRGIVRAVLIRDAARRPARGASRRGGASGGAGSPSCAAARPATRPSRPSAPRRSTASRRAWRSRPESERAIGRWLPMKPPQCRPGERSHPGGDAGGRDRDHPAPRGGGRSAIPASATVSTENSAASPTPPTTG